VAKTWQQPSWLAGEIITPARSTAIGLCPEAAIGSHSTGAASWRELRHCQEPSQRRSDIWIVKYTGIPGASRENTNEKGTAMPTAVTPGSLEKTIVDEVIRPRDTRRRLAVALWTLDAAAVPTSAVRNIRSDTLCAIGESGARTYLAAGAGGL
jgi:hypothetical protein